MRLASLVAEAKEKAAYDFAALKRHTAHLHKTIDTERDNHERLLGVKKDVAEKIEEANSRLGVDERELILKERELEKRAKKFIARFSLRLAFMAFRKRIARQKEVIGAKPLK